MAPSVNMSPQHPPGTCVLIAGGDAPDLALRVIRDGAPGLLVLNRRGPGGHLAVRMGAIDGAELRALAGAVVAPAGAVSGIIRGDGILPAALHLGSGGSYPCGRDETGWLTAFDVRSGQAAAIDLAALPQVAQWRVLVPGPGGGLVTVYAAEPA